MTVGMTKQKQIDGLPAAIASRVPLSLYTAYSVAVNQNLAGNPEALTLSPNSLVIRNDGASGTIANLTIGTNSVVGRGASGNIVSLPFATLKASLAIGASDLVLPLDNIYLGNASSVAVATPITSIPLSDFGAPTAPIDFGAEELTNLAAGTTPNSAVTLSQVTALIASTGGYNEPEANNLTAGSMDFITLSFTPTEPAKTILYFNGTFLEYGADYTITGAQVTATTALNVRYGGSGANGLGFDSTDRVIVFAR